MVQAVEADSEVLTRMAAGQAFAQGKGIAGSHAHVWFNGVLHTATSGWRQALGAGMQTELPLAQASPHLHLPT